MRKIAVLSLFLCLVAVCRAQYIGSQYMNVKLGYIVDESQVQGTFGFGKVYKAFKVGANLNYRNLSWRSESAPQHALHSWTPENTASPYPSHLIRQN